MLRVNVVTAAAVVMLTLLLVGVARAESPWDHLGTQSSVYVDEPVNVGYLHGHPLESVDYRRDCAPFLATGIAQEEDAAPVVHEDATGGSSLAESGHWWSTFKMWTFIESDCEDVAPVLGPFYSRHAFNPMCHTAPY